MIDVFVVIVFFLFHFCWVHQDRDTTIYACMFVCVLYLSVFFSINRCDCVFVFTHTYEILDVVDSPSDDMFWSFDWSYVLNCAFIYLLFCFLFLFFVCVLKTSWYPPFITLCFVWPPFVFLYPRQRFRILSIY